MIPSCFFVASSIDPGISSSTVVDVVVGCRKRPSISLVVVVRPIAVVEDDDVTIVDSVVALLLL